MDVNSGNSGGEPGFFGVDAKFGFDCHPGLSCFGQCCRDINIFLTPYDIQRLRRKLGISSGVFLKKYTCELELPQLKFPLIYLKMNEEGRLECPFVTEKGCAVYKERPWSCRMAPVDIAGPGVYRFAFDRKKCLGLNEAREWTVADWMRTQEMDAYDGMEKTFKELPFLIRLTGQEGLDRRMTQLFRMVCYDTDTFKEFIMSNRFLFREGGMDQEDFKKSLQDDARLLNNGIQWLVNICSNEKSLKKIDNILKGRS